MAIKLSLIALLLSMSGIPLFGQACNPNAPSPTFTPYLSLALPSHNSCNWDQWINPDLSTLDTFAQSTNGSIANINAALPTFIVSPANACSQISNLASGSLNPACYTGTDIGAKINAAYAALPAAGGVIEVAQGGSYATPIVFGTNGKHVLLKGSPGGAVTLTYTPIAGTAITFDAGTGLMIGDGMRDITLTGPGYPTNTVGIQVGIINGAQGTDFKDFKIESFGTNVKFGSNTWIVAFRHGMIRDGGNNVIYPGGLTQSGENIQFDHVTFADAPSALNIAQSVWIQGSTQEITFTDCSFDSAGLWIGNSTIGSAQVNVKGSHWENPNFGTDPDYSYITIDNSTGDVLRLSDSYFLQDRLSGAAYPPFVNEMNGELFISGLAMYNPVASTSLIALGGPANVQLFGFNDLSGSLSSANLYSGTTTSGCLVSFPGSSAGSGTMNNSIIKCGDHTSGASFDINSGNLRTSHQLVSTVGTGTAPLVVNSFTPVQNLRSDQYPLVYTQSGTLLTSNHIVMIETAIVSGGNATASWPIGQTFTSASSYVCSVSDASNGVLSPAAYVRNTGTQITVYGTDSDSITGMCVGN